MSSGAEETTLVQCRSDILNTITQLCPESISRLWCCGNANLQHTMSVGGVTSVLLQGNKQTIAFPLWLFQLRQLRKLEIANSVMESFMGMKREEMQTEMQKLPRTIQSLTLRFKDDAAVFLLDNATNGAAEAIEETISGGRGSRKAPRRARELWSVGDTFPKLTSLAILGADDQSDFDEHWSETAPLDLPDSLTCLVSNYPTADGWSLKNLPRSLTKLVIPDLSGTPKELRSPPPHLEHLQVADFDPIAKMVNGLPASLSYLHIEMLSGDFTPSTLKKLPHGLKTLKVDVMEGSDFGMKEAAALPHSLTCLDLAQPFVPGPSKHIKPGTWPSELKKMKFEESTLSPQALFKSLPCSTLESLTIGVLTWMPDNDEDDDNDDDDEDNEKSKRLADLEVYLMENQAQNLLHLDIAFTDGDDDSTELDEVELFFKWAPNLVSVTIGPCVPIKCLKLLPNSVSTLNFTSVHPWCSDLLDSINLSQSLTHIHWKLSTSEEGSPGVLLRRDPETNSWKSIQGLAA